jgi:enoyl-[acyl-carrier protein] reductase I
MLLEGKKILVTGVLTDDSIAFSCARVSQEAGAEIVLTSFGRAMSITQRIARRLDPVPDVLEMDVNDGAQIAAVAADLEQRWGRLDGLLHAIGFAPQDAMGGGFLDTPWESAAVAFQTSAFSLKALTAGMLPLLKVSGADGGASVVSLTFDARYAWPIYDWMGVAKAGLESITRYLARDLGPSGIRVNTVSAGPIRSMAGKNIPGFAQLTGRWGERAPLGWDVNDSMPVGRMVCFLLSDWAPLTTGELIHVDGGFHALGIGARESSAEEPANQGQG